MLSGKIEFSNAGSSTVRRTLNDSGMQWRALAEVTLRWACDGKSKPIYRYREVQIVPYQEPER